jgi:MFS family permease
MTANSDQDNLVETKLTAGHYAALLICVIVMAIDGFDVLTISYVVAPLSGDWHLAPTDVGLLLSAGLVGAIVGTTMLSSVADLIGRKPFIVLCLAIMAVGMVWCALTGSLSDLAAARVLSGVGLGAASTVLVAITYECMPPDRRRIALGFLATGFPLGAAVGGYISVWLVPAYGWRSVFWFGAALSLAIMPVTLWRLPESISFLMEKRPKNALTRLNRARKLMHLAPLDALPIPTSKSVTSGLLESLRGLPGAAVLKWSAIYFLFMASFYFILSWAAKLISQLGFPSNEGITVSSLITAGGVGGSLTAALLTKLLGVRPGAVIVLVAITVLIAAFPSVARQGVQVYILALALGWVMWAAVVNLYALTAGEFSASVRGSGLGLTLGAGRVGAVFGPYIAGALLGNGVSLDSTCLILGVPAAAAAVILLLERSKSRSCRADVPASEVSDLALAKADYGRPLAAGAVEPRK